jgi:hypothetical protein
VAINAWNEWAEGMSLEPSDVYGRRFLEVIRDVKAQFRGDGCSSGVELSLETSTATKSHEKIKNGDKQLPDFDSSISTEMTKDETSQHGSSDHGETENRLPRVLVIYFPQYHRDPLNDGLWGENFTDWNNLKKAPAKNRMGYAIPRPSELGYYDLTDFEPRKRQGELAREYGIDGFIYHHYWFYDPTHPGPSLAAPLLKMLRDGEPNVPFLFNWCAVSWYNKWMGNAINQTKWKDKNGHALMLQKQYFDPSDDMIREHYEWLSQFFHHKNYIKIDNQPVFLMYTWFKEANFILERLRYYAKQDGFDGIYLIAGRSGPPEHIYVPENLSSMNEEKLNRSDTVDSLPMRIFNQTMNYPYPLEYVTSPLSVPQWCLDGAKHHPTSLRPEITGVCSTFDNTPRRSFKTSSIWNSGKPKKVLERFNTSLRAAVHLHTCCYERTNDRFVAINAWNEWAEGMSLEPSDVYGRGFLEVIRDVKAQVRKDGCSGSVELSR